LYGFAPDGQYAGSLNNSGEHIVYASAAGDTILSFDYKDSDPWPLNADGFGNSLVSVNTNPTGDPNYAAYWRASSNINGSPGNDDIPSGIFPVYINEILTHTDSPAVDAIEIFNPNGSQVNISGWYLTDDFSNPMQWRISDGSTIDAGGFLVINAGHYTNDSLEFASSEFGATFSLSSHGEDIYLFSSDESGNLNGYVTGFAFGEEENGVSIGRYLTSENKIHYVSQKSVTLGSENSGPRVGPIIFNKINYNPAGTNSEFVELVNITPDIVNLYDEEFPQNTWKIEGLGFEFPPDISIPANGLIYLVDNTTLFSTFRTEYALPQSVQIFAYAGGLNNAGEAISLLKPEEPFDTGDSVVVPYLLIEKVKYNDKGSWPEEADGNGSMLIRINQAEYANDPVNWASEVVVAVDESDNSVTLEFALSHNYPNPFNPSTTIKYNIPVGDANFTSPILVQLKVYDLLGQEVKTLVKEEKPAGQYEVKFDASHLASGVYLYRLQAGEFTEVKKMILMK
jgi:hypothetical protein